MKCPNCLSIMKCISEIHNIPGQPGRQRMDLHCYNRSDPREPNRCYARTHMGVITEDPKVWECQSYNFEFKIDPGLFADTYYLASGKPVYGNTYSTEKTILLKTIWRGVNFDDNTPGDSWIYKEEIELINLPYFIPLSTGDDMHEKAWSLFYKLKNLAIYS